MTTPLIITNPESSLAVDDSTAGDAFALTNGPPESGFQTSEFTDPATAIIFANQTDFIVVGGGTQHAVTLDNPNPAAGLEDVTFESLGAGSDIEGGSTSGADITVQELQLEFTGAGDIGDTRALRTQVNTLYVNDAGNVRITNGVSTPTTLLAGVNATGFVNLTNNGTINTALAGFPGIIGSQGVNITTTGSTADLDTGSGAVIESSAGAVSLQVGEDINLGDAVGNGAVLAETGINLSAGRNVTLNANATIGNFTSGIISINAGMAGAGGNITMLTSPGSLAGEPEIVNSASTGSISLTTGAGGTLTVASTGTTGILSNNGAITLAADEMVISAAINSGTATTTLEPVTAGQAINLGGTNASGVLGLTQAELNKITAGTLRIGNIIAGNITITAAISNPSGDQIVSLVNNGTISEGAFGSLSIPNLRISSTGPVTLGSTNNIIATLAANASNGLTVNDNTHILTIGTVDTVTGLVAINNAINLTADGMNLGQQVYAGSAIVTLSTFSAAQQISLGGTSGNISGTLGLSDTELGEITASVLRIDADTGNITTGGTISSHAGYSTLSLATAGAISLTNDVSVTNLALNAGLGIAVDGTNTIGTLAFSNAANNVVITDFAPLTIGAVDGITSSSNLGTTTTIDVDGNMTFATGLFSAGAATLTAVGASFVDQGNGAFVDVTAQSLTLAAQTGVGTSAAPLQTQIGALSATTTTGGIFIDNDILVPGTLNIGVGTTGVGAGSGNISIINNGTINSLISGANISGSGNITLKALGANADINIGGQATAFSINDTGSSGLVDVEAGRDLNLGNSAGLGAIDGGSGTASVKLVAGRNLTIDPNAYVLVSGSITATAGGNFTMLTTPGTLGDEFITGGGAISLAAGAGATMTLTSSGAIAVSSSGGNITLTADFLNIGKAINAGAGYVLIEPVTAGEQIGLGSAATGGLTLSNTELDDITAKTIIIGNSTAGEVSLAGSVAPASGTNLAINTGSGVIASGSINLGAGVLSIGFDQSGTGATVDLSNAAITASSVQVEGGTGNDTFISGGSGETFIGGSGADTFEGTAAHLNGDTITNLKVGDKIDLLNLPFSVGGTATLDTGNVLQIEEDGQAIFLNLNPSQNFAGDAFVLSSDGQGGTDISPEPQQQLLATGLRFVGAGRSGTASDTLVLQNSANATPTLWTVSGTSAAVTLEPSPGPGVQLVALGDLLSNGNADLLFQTSSGAPEVWLMNGTTVANGLMLPNPGPGWTIDATGDAFDTGFDNTILWQNTGDLPVLWEMNGATIVNDVALPDPGPGWTMLGTGDFFHTGFNNTILWQDSAGLPALWEMNGGTIVNDVALPNPGPGWSIRAIGNFFGDGHDDSLLWQDTAGLPVLWEMNGGTIVNDVALPNPGSNWTIQGVGVVTGNGDYDIFFQDTAGQVAEWSMNGSQLLASNLLTSNSLTLDAPNTAATGSGSEQITFNSTNQTFIDGSTVYNDTVVGFSQPQGDRIHLTTDTVADALAHTTQVNSGQDTLIQLSDSSTILLKGVTSINSSFFA